MEKEYKQIIEGLLSHLKSEYIYLNSPHNDTYEYYNDLYEKIKEGK